jgi:serine/threonine protein kinase
MSLGCIEPYLHQSIFDALQFNVLIDDSGRGVLCDFGLSRVKTNVTSRTTKQSRGDVVGSRSWMAPERLMGGSLKKPCDIYAFGITLHEVSFVVFALKSIPI